MVPSVTPPGKKNEAARMITVTHNPNKKIFRGFILFIPKKHKKPLKHGSKVFRILQ
jgi:hypothetical protein